MRVSLQYGSDGLDVEIPSDDVTRIEPRFVPGLADERAAFRAALAAPIGRAALASLIGSRERVAIVLGFIEPHFMAGFSGGYKGIFPAVADIARSCTITGQP